MRFALIVQSPLERAAAALAFAIVAVKSGHHLPRVFFFADGVLVARPGELAERWAALASSEHIELSVCVSSAARRGLSDVPAAAADAQHSAIAPGFTIAGLGLLVEATATADRVVTFL